MKTLLFVILLALVQNDSPAQSTTHGKRILDLRGDWMFMVGDKPAWADPRFDDRNWDVVFVPAAWENEGFSGYDGFAWYRKHFRMPAGAKNKKVVYLTLGRIDDADEVFLNGHAIGSQGRMPPDFETAYHMFRVYAVPTEFLNFRGDNVLAVRVYDTQLEGGILEGRVELFEPTDYPALAVDLSGSWLFRPGDHPEWKNRNISRTGWVPITVPAYWEPQGFAGYDGVAWYRNVFYLPSELKNQDLVLVLGKVDDLDEVYINGKKIGATGRVGSRNIGGDEWQKKRVYPIPHDALIFGDKNLISVRVYDGLYGGGIYEGPVGLMTRADYESSKPGIMNYWREFWDSIKESW